MARFVHLPGLTPYAVGYELQKRLLQARIDDRGPDVVLLLEHERTITVGRQRGALANVLDAGDTPVFPIERGGDVTWHGPGQLVAYPILKLEGPRADLHLHLHSIEDAVLGLLAELGLGPVRDPRNTGVWLPARSGPARKVCSVGIACRRWVTWHGLALNVTSDLQEFARINPCGFDAGVMTSLQDHLQPPPLDDLVQPLARHLSRALAVPIDEMVTIPANDLLSQSATLSA